MTPPLPSQTEAPVREAEAFVAWLWQRRLFADPWLRLLDGTRLRVVFTGRHWGGAGPDFRGAVLERPDGSLVRGDVEVHARAGDWWAHGHQRDSEYTTVMLHVVLHGSRDARRCDGASVATAALAEQLAAPLADLRLRFAREPAAEPALPAFPRDPEQLAALLEAAGLRRFLARAARLEADLSCTALEQVLYRELLVALGYSVNKTAAGRLADLLPYDELAGALLALAPERRPIAAQALLLGRAGLLPQTELPVPGELLVAWSALDARDAPRLPRSAWRLRQTRPDNHPSRRLAGFGLWLAARAGRDWVGEFAELVRQAAVAPRLDRLAEPFRVQAADDFWPWHADFGRPLGRARPWLIGGGRALAMVVNVLLPACHALGQARGDDTLSAAALRCYRRLPAPPENRVTRYMAQELAPPAGRRVWRDACRQQGLLHLFQAWCAERRCDECPAGGAAQMGLV